MGLDLMLYKTKDYDVIKDSDNYEDFEKIELCYGRKTWTIFQFFRDRALTATEDDSEVVVPYSAIQEFVDLIEPYYNMLYDIEKEYRIAEYTEDPNYEFPSNIYRMEAEFFSVWGNDDCTLGRDWEIAAILKWYEALKDILDDGDTFTMIASY